MELQLDNQLELQLAKLYQLTQIKEQQLTVECRAGDRKQCMNWSGAVHEMIWIYLCSWYYLMTIIKWLDLWSEKAGPQTPTTSIRTVAKTGTLPEKTKKSSIALKEENRDVDEKQDHSKCKISSAHFLLLSVSYLKNQESPSLFPIYLKSAKNRTS